MHDLNTRIRNDIVEDINEKLNTGFSKVFLDVSDEFLSTANFYVSLTNAGICSQKV